MAPHHDAIASSPTGDSKDLPPPHSSDSDIDIEADLSPSNSDPPSPETISRIYRTLDLRILPPLWTLYFLCSAIRSNVGLAQTMNIDTSHDLPTTLNLTPHQISTALALFYVCYVLFDLPSNLIMTRLAPHIWLSRIVISVGVIGACMAAMKAAWSLYLLRLLLGIVIAGMWPGMAYYLTLFYPPSRTGKRIGMYFTAAQVSAAVVGLVSAGFQKMDGLAGLLGWQWMFLLYGLVGIIVGFALIWWLPDRPVIPGQEAEQRKGYFNNLIPRGKPVLVGRDAEIHYHDLKRVYQRSQWTMRDVANVLMDWRLWPLTIMYFGVVGVGIGVQSYGTVIISGINPDLTGVQLSLLFAPIWIMDLLAILLITPLSDRFHHHRPLFFSLPVLLQIAGLLLTTFAKSWASYTGLLLIGFGLGPTVPITMTWTAELFQPRHGEVGVAAACAVVSGLGNLGSILTTYALYEGWRGPGGEEGAGRNSNFVMVGILGGSLVAAVLMGVLVRVVDGKKGGGGEGVDGAAEREREQRGLKGLWFGGKK
ncbi:hypothetical protein FQN54_000460 [Arachnomyces sp. PD_36]|nr:hypothetical protein FQN54_000460 [Arachnomyces sp. PD_36]